MSDTQQEVHGDTVESARQALAELREEGRPSRQKTTKKAQIKELEIEIRELLKDGWSVKDIATALSKGGIEITPNALKNQLYKIHKEEIKKNEKDNKEKIIRKNNQTKEQTQKEKTNGLHENKNESGSFKL